MRDFTGLLKIAKVTRISIRHPTSSAAGAAASPLKPFKVFDFDVGDIIPGQTDSTLGNGIMTRSRDVDYNGVRGRMFDYRGNVHYPSDFIEIPEITRLIQSDGSVKYRVTRRIPTSSRDSVGRTITDHFSVIVDNPRDAMRLAKGKASFDPDTGKVLKSVRESVDGFMVTPQDMSDLRRKGIDLGTPVSVPKKFGISVGSGVDNGVKRVKKFNLRVEKANYFKMLRRLARLHPGKAKAIGAAAIGIPALTGAGLLVATGNDNDVLRIPHETSLTSGTSGIPIAPLLAGGALTAGGLAALMSHRRKKRRNKDRK